VTRTVGLFIGHENDPLTQIERVFFKGATAITQGYGVCYVLTYATALDDQAAADAWGKRDKIVDAPDYANAHQFAGVAARSYDANSAGQWIDIYVPGSTCKIYVNAALTIGDKVICMVDDAATGSDNGQFMKSAWAGFGLGCAVIEQTAASGDEYVQARLIDYGGQSGLYQSTDAMVLGAQLFSLEGVSAMQEHEIETSNASYTLADGTWCGQRKTFVVIGALTTSDLLITLATAGVQVDQSTAFTTITLNAAGEYAVLEWQGNHWLILNTSGADLASS